MSDPSKSPSPVPPPGVLDRAVAKRRLEAFVATVKRVVSAARQHAGPVGNNSVVVDRTGKSYPTINAALASISDASEQKEYVLLIGAGVYSEVLTCKPWVFLSGAGQEQTLITAMTEPNSSLPATITAASHSAVQNCTVRASTIGPFDPPVTAILCQGAFDFDIEDCAVIALASNDKTVTGLTLDSGAEPSGLHVNVAYTTVNASGGGKPIAISATNGAFGHGMQSAFVAEKGSAPGMGGLATNGASLVLDDCSVQGLAYSLYKDAGPSSITANQCKLTGPVGPGVVVNP